MADKKRDYYEVLGVSKNATEDEIKKAYRKLAKQFHPDVSKEDNAEDKFKEATEAAEILLDASKRQTYDQFGHEGLGGFGGSGGGFGGFGDFFSGMGGQGGGDFFSDIFENIFGGRGANQRNAGPSRGKDMVIDLNLKLKELLLGVNKDVELSLIDICDDCEGVGAKNKSDISVCELCNGAGQVTVIQDMGIAKFQTQKTCPKCRGEGHENKNPCKKCRGEGLFSKKETITFPVPKGLVPGQQIVLRNAGNYSSDGGERGHLYANINVVMPKRTRIVNEYDIEFTIDVNYLDAILGNTIVIKTFDGEEKISVPAGVVNGQTLIISKKGLNKGVKSNSSGNLLLKVNIVVPTKITHAEKSAFELIQKDSDFEVENNINK